MTNTGSVVIREGRADDAVDLARMINNFNIEEGSPGRLTTDVVVALCFADQKRYASFVAEEGCALVGYALVMSFYDTESCAWCSYMQDLYVDPARRSVRIGRRLAAAVAQYTLDRGRHELAWHVRDHNHRGRAFYASIGAEEQAPITATLSKEAMKRLVEEA